MDLAALDVAGGPSVPDSSPPCPSSSPHAAVSIVDVEGTVNSIVDRLTDLITVQKVIFQGKADRWGTCFISVCLVGASDDVVKRVQDAWLDRLQASVASIATANHLKRKITKRVSRGTNKIESSVITSEMMRKIDLGVFGFPSLRDNGDGSDESGEGSIRIMLYLNELYGYLEKELADRIKRVRDNHRLWVVAGIRH